MLMTPELPLSNKELIYEQKFRYKELELNSILEITRAINNNASEESLYMMYKFTLRANLDIQKLALFVKEETWQCKVYFGTQTDFEAEDFKYELPPTQLIREEVTQLDQIEGVHPAFAEFDLLIPIYHKDNLMAVVFLENLSELNQDQDGMIDTTKFVQMLSNVIIVAIENKKLVRKQLSQEALRKELEIARSVQSRLFPKQLPNLPHLQVEATYLPNDMVGGDYYDFIPLEAHKFICCIADVSGKGVPASLLMANFQASLRVLARQTQDLGTILEELNFLIYDHVQGENFITFFVMLFDLEKKTVKYVNAGHNPAFWVDEDQSLQPLENGTTILGAFEALPFLKVTELAYDQSFTVFTYTDGVTELRNDAGEEYGTTRLQDFFARQPYAHQLKAIHQDLIKNLDVYREEQLFCDDVTLFSVRICL